MRGGGGTSPNDFNGGDTFASMPKVGVVGVY